jgi:hypothetical protein
MTGDEWANVISVANQGALSWYGTLTGKEIASGRPRSLMGDVLGNDLGGGPTPLGQSLGSLAPVVIVGLLVVGVVLVARR